MIYASSVARRESPPTWVVIGHGFIGSALTEHLSSIGLRVRQTSAPRLSAPIGSSPEFLATEAAKLPALGKLAEQFSDADCVVLAAGLARPDARASAELTGANALLPGLVAVAARQQSVRRFIHLSSAAVQGRARVLTESSQTAPFSAYSRSKALGEAVINRLRAETVSTVIVRATSVQGPGRATTESLQKVARSPISSVARPGTQPSAVSSVQALCRFVRHVGAWPDAVPPIVLQPWEGLSVAEVLNTSGGRPPRPLPRSLCTAALAVGYSLSRLGAGSLHGLVRRVEAMWFGQVVAAEWAAWSGFAPEPAPNVELSTVLAKLSGPPSENEVDIDTG